MIEKTFRVDCRHAAGAGRCNGLSINRILYVAAGENARNVRGRRMSGSLDVADLVHVEPAFEKVRVWLVTDGDKHAGAWKLALLACLQIAQPHAIHAILLRSENLLHGRVPDKLDLLIMERLVLHDLRSAQLVAPVNDINFRRVAREESSFLHRRVPATDYDDYLVTKSRQWSIARGAGRDAVTTEPVRHFRLAGNAEPLRGSAGRDD